MDFCGTIIQTTAVAEHILISRQYMKNTTVNEIGNNLALIELAS
jgi:hypothetical protein